MTFYNIKNPDQAVYGKGEWIHVAKDDTDPKKAEVEIKSVYSKVWGKINTKLKPVDAGRLQDALVKAGLEVEHDPSVTPNGVTTSTAGILIVFKNQLTAAELSKLDQVMQAVEDDDKDEFFTPMPTTDGVTTLRE